MIIFCLAASSDDDDRPRLVSSESILTQSSLQVGLDSEEIPRSSHHEQLTLTDGASHLASLVAARHLTQQTLTTSQYEIDHDEGDVTERYLTSHYRKDTKM